MQKKKKHMEATLAQMFSISWFIMQVSMISPVPCQKFLIENLFANDFLKKLMLNRIDYHLSQKLELIGVESTFLYFTYFILVKTCLPLIVDSICC